MDYFTIIVMSDERSPMRRIQLPKIYLTRAFYGAAAVALLFMVATWDYWRMRSDNSELAELRIQTAEQTEQIETVEETLQNVRGELTRMQELERKVRIIANLPGAAGVGGEEINAVGPEQGDRVAPPAGVPVDMPLPVQGPSPDDSLSQARPHPQADLEVPEVLAANGMTTDGARHVSALDGVAKNLTEHVVDRSESLTLLLQQLDDKRNRLSSMPSVWPTKGWITSRYGYRISPFTGRRQLHAGLDIATEPGSPIVAPARGKVKFVGRKGPLGNAVIIDHGFGVETIYGHTQEVFVSRGEEIVRGQQIATVGNSGRSTGPHLHYVVEVDGRTQDPLDFIFD